LAPRSRRPQTVSVHAPLPDEATALFREQPEAFVAARDALVARLRSEGRAEEAAAIKALRRPTAVVWALNQLSTRDPSGIRDLLSAGSELRAAQQATLSSSGTGADRLRSAGAARRAAVAQLARVAVDVLEEAGRGVRAEEVASALESASVEGETGERLAAGTLERLPEPVAGFGDVFGLTAIPGDAQEEPAAGPSASRRSSTPPSDASRAEAEAEVARFRRDRDAAARRAKKARETAKRLVVRVEGMRERLIAAEAVHAEADASARGAELDAARAERDLAAATKRLDALTRER
jgi:hypothetical protein